MQETVVDLGDRSYPIQVGFGLLQENASLRRLAEGRQVCVVSDSTVGPLHGARLRQELSRSAAEVAYLEVPAGESSKDWVQLDRICSLLLERRFDRRSLLVALGGGVVGDLVGLAAALYQRGIDFVQVPTTLLAQVDSSVGGKTAINHPLGKNMIGAFHQPRLVVADVATLRTLPPRELVAGLAEVIKHGAIADLDYLGRIEECLGALLAGDQDALAEIVSGSIRIKASVVAADEREGGRRAELNFGHTFGHAIEAGLGFGVWLHGEAVGCGMVMAASLSRSLGLLDEAERRRLVALIEAAGLPIEGPAWAPSRYRALMETDKKAVQGRPRFVLLDGLGRATLRTVEVALVDQAIRAHAARGGA